MALHQQKFHTATFPLCRTICRSMRPGARRLLKFPALLHLMVFLDLSSPVLLTVERRGYLVILHLFKSTPINLLSFPNKCRVKQEDIRIWG